LDWPGSQDFWSALVTIVLMLRSASAPPCASTPSLIRSFGLVWADAGVKAVVANSAAAEISNPYFMPSSPVFLQMSLQVSLQVLQVCSQAIVAFHGGAAIAAERSLR
jgi:hypothetical protein